MVLWGRGVLVFFFKAGGGAAASLPRGAARTSVRLGLELTLRTKVGASEAALRSPQGQD
jgi:hypothetical protein